MRIIRPNRRTPEPHTARAWMVVGVALSCSLGAGAVLADRYERVDQDTRYERQYDYQYGRNAERDRQRAANVYAENDEWGDLNADEQRALQAHRRNWNTYSPQQRTRLRQGVQRYYNLTPEQRNEVNRGRDRYERMSPEERERARERYQRSRERDD